MLFMQFKLGPDMALCLIKSILFALLAAFIVMPGLLMLFGPLIDRTQHRSFVPKISFVGKLDFATRYIIPLVFVALAVIGFRLSSNCPYAYVIKPCKTAPMPTATASSPRPSRMKRSLPSR